MKQILLVLLGLCFAAPVFAVDVDVYPAPLIDQSPHYRLPAFEPGWGLSRHLFENARAYYEANKNSISNQRFVLIADFNQHSSHKRLYLFDLASGKVEQHIVAHGSGSDPNSTGYATLFSNEPNSLMSSLGFYLTLGTYVGEFGYSMRLHGLESTNSNAEARAIIMHPMGGMDESQGVCSLSWGCPALDPRISQSVIDRVHGGALLLIGK
jgi:L,D-transpeptidase catalytic domain